MHGTRRSLGGGTSGATARGLPSHAQLIARAVAIMAELSTTLAALGVAAEAVMVAPVIEEVAGALSTKEAAKRLGCSPHTVADRVRRGELQACQHMKRGRYSFEPAELERYRGLHQTGRVADRIADTYSAAYDQRRVASAPTRPRIDARGARPRARGDHEHGRAVGTRCARRKPTSGACTLAPGAGAWSGDDEPEGS